jgi:hypothetical protein
MNVQLAAFLAGMFVVPAVLLSIGHRIRKRPAKIQSAFWGGMFAHILASVAAITASMIAAEEWQSSDFWRGLFGFWMMLVAPLIGATIGYALGGKSAKR